MEQIIIVSELFHPPGWMCGRMKWVESWDVPQAKHQVDEKVGVSVCVGGGVGGGWQLKTSYQTCHLAPSTWGSNLGRGPGVWSGHVTFPSHLWDLKMSIWNQKLFNKRFFIIIHYWQKLLYFRWNCHFSNRLNCSSFFFFGRFCFFNYLSKWSYLKKDLKDEEAQLGEIPAGHHCS